MIENIILLLVANTITPYIFVPPVVLAPLPLAQVLIEPPSVLQSMNLSRLYTHNEFRHAFRASLKVHHPDHGGSQQIFQQIQGLKKIMSKQTNYYDLYNLTDSDISTTNMQLKEAVAIKQYSYYVQTGIFYFITLLYILAFTLDSDSKKSRMLMLGLTIAFGVYQLYMHQYPKSITLIDLLYSKLPLFTQRKFMKRTLIIWISLIRVYFMRKKCEQEELLGQLKKERSIQEYKDVLERLKEINLKKLQDKEQYDKSWGTKIRNWISKGISGLFLIIIIKNMIPGLNFF